MPIRPATKDDAHELAQLKEEVAARTYAGFLQPEDLGHWLRRTASSVHFLTRLRAGDHYWVEEQEAGERQTGEQDRVTGAEESTGGIVGLVGIGQIASHLFLEDLYVRNPGEGIGTRLLAEALGPGEERPILCDVYAANFGALAFFQRLGFRPVSTWSLGIPNGQIKRLALSPARLQMPDGGL